MKKFLLLLIGAVVLFSCKDDKEEEMGLPPVINLEENRYYVEVGASQVISPTYENTDNETLYLWTRDGKQVGHEPTYTFKMSTAGTYYDIQGRKVANPRKGIYIVNGKKVIK